MEAFRDPARAGARIALTYEQAAVFLDCYGESLPSPAKETVEAYLRTRKYPKLRRVLAVRRGGYTMQSRTARWGQALFG